METARCETPTSGDGPLILGLGNLLLRDEGAGVHVARALIAELATTPDSLPPGATVVDGGTLGLTLLPLLERTRALVVVDAAELGLPAGSVRVLRDGALWGRLGGHLSSHQVGLADLLDVARLAGTLPERVALVGVQPGSVAVGLALTPPVAAAMPMAIEEARAQSWALVREVAHA